MAQHKLGLKLWSTNEHYIEEALRLYQGRSYDYIELFVVPGTHTTHGKMWAAVGIPFIIHAPHYDKGMNLAKREQFDGNMVLAREALAFADTLRAETVIFHPGVEGDIVETARQLTGLHDPRIVVENKPHFGFHGVLCNGSSPEEIRYVMREARVGFCLDIGHAICSANTKKADPIAYLNEFLALEPTMYHLTDGQYSGTEDRHDHFGRGNYPLTDILTLLPQGSMITIETVKDSETDLNDFEKDINFVKTIV
jgi:deoxyribonuclease-4